MKIRNLELAAVFAFVAALAACDASSVTGPQEETQSEPSARTACTAGGEVAQRAGCPEDTWDSDEPVRWTPPAEKNSTPREKFPN